MNYHIENLSLRRALFRERRATRLLTIAAVTGWALAVSLMFMVPA